MPIRRLAARRKNEQLDRTANAARGSGLCLQRLARVPLLRTVLVPGSLTATVEPRIRQRLAKPAAGSQPRVLAAPLPVGQVDVRPVALRQPLSLAAHTKVLTTLVASLAGVLALLVQPKSPAAGAQT